MNDVLFFALTCQGSAPTPKEPPQGFETKLWDSSPTKVSPDGTLRPAFWVWWLFRQLSVFANREYSAVTVHRSGRRVHRSMVFPRFFRFPFMGREDLQIGDTYTDPDERGRGLARHAIAAALAAHWREGRTFWYVVRADNGPSIRAARAAGLRLVGRGRKVPRAGLKLLGAYRILEAEPHPD